MKPSFLANLSLQKLSGFIMIKREKLLVTTSKISKKTKKSSQKTNSIFSIDDENFPYKGVKCKGSVTIVEDPNRTF
jgi:hypothetical protein